jgi:hypothetical protein
VNGFGVITWMPGLTRSPQLDVLRVAVAHDEDDHRVGDNPAVRVGGPVLRHEALAGEQVDVRRQRERDQIRVLAGRDGARLIARRAVGLAEARAIPGLRLLEGGDDLSVRVLGRRVGDQVDRAALRRARRRPREQRNPEQSNPNNSHSFSLSLKFVHGVDGD